MLINALLVSNKITDTKPTCGYLSDLDECIRSCTHRDPPISDIEVHIERIRLQADSEIN